MNSPPPRFPEGQREPSSGRRPLLLIDLPNRFISVLESVLKVSDSPTGCAHRVTGLKTLRPGSNGRACPPRHRTVKLSIPSLFAASSPISIRAAPRAVVHTDPRAAIHTEPCAAIHTGTRDSLSRIHTVCQHGPGRDILCLVPKANKLSYSTLPLRTIIRSAALDLRPELAIRYLHRPTGNPVLRLQGFSFTIHVGFCNIRIAINR